MGRKEAYIFDGPRGGIYDSLLILETVGIRCAFNHMCVR